MNAVASQHLDEILSEWHRWMRSYSPSLGYSPRAAGFAMYRASRQYDHDDGRDDESEEMSQAVDAEVSKMADPHRSAIHMAARNLCTARNVWVSARVQACGRDADQVIAEARQMLWGRLVAVGMVDKVVMLQSI